VKIDIVSIFPEIFDALDVSLMGKATASHLVDLSITNLRDFATGVHKAWMTPPMAAVQAWS